MAPMAVPSNGIPLGVPMSNHEYDMTDADSFNKGPVRVGANPPPAWSQCKIDRYLWNSLETISDHFTDVGPVHKAPPSVATQLVVPTDLSDGPVSFMIKKSLKRWQNEISIFHGYGYGFMVFWLTK